MLRQQNLTRFVTLPVSAGLLSDIDTYIAGLTSYREGQLTPIIQCVTDATFAALANSRQLVEHLSGLHEDWASRLSVRSDAAARRLLRLLPAQPVLNTSYVTTSLSISAVAAARAITELSVAGILSQTSLGRRNRIWECPEVLEALDAFAERAGRRARPS